MFPIKLISYFFKIKYSQIRSGIVLFIIFVPALHIFLISQTYLDPLKMHDIPVKKINLSATHHYKKVLIQTVNPKHSVFRMKNNGKELASFTVKINGKQFYEKNSDFLDELITTPNDKNFGKNLWSYLSKMHRHDIPISKSNEYHTPSLYFNSFGFGFCDDISSIFAILSNENNYKSRVWYLDGHVVPEIVVDKKLEMYDPDLGVFFTNKDGDVASIKDIISNPKLLHNINIPSQKYTVLSNLLLKKRRNYYIAKNKDIFTSTQNNRSTSIPMPLPKKIKFNLKLPPKAKIEFPHKWKKNALNVRNLKIKNYSNLKLTLPSGWTGVIDIPLAVHSMKGTGKVNTYLKGTMTTQKLNSFLESNDKNLITSYNIIESHTPIEIIYFLNPKLFDIQMTNIITLYGNNVNKIDISTTIK